MSSSRAKGLKWSHLAHGIHSNVLCYHKKHWYFSHWELTCRQYFLWTAKSVFKFAFYSIEHDSYGACHSSRRQSPLPHRGGPSLNLGQSKRYLWWITWHWDRFFPWISLKTNSHIARRAHAVPLLCRATKGLEYIFPIWFTQCGRVWFTLAMPRPCHAVPWPWEEWHGQSMAWARHGKCESATVALCKSNGKDTL